MIGLFFGSFNPIHIGHTALANYLLNHTALEEIWFVVSPQNPMKEEADLLPEQLRLELVNLALADNPHFKSCDVEFSLLKPNYTILTLECLHALYPDKQFALIIGADNLAVFDRWTDSQRILKSYPIYVYPREGFDLESLSGTYPQVKIVDAPLFPISATQIREFIAQKKDASVWLHPSVYEVLKST